MTSTIHAPDPIAELWQAARLWFAETLAVFGQPVAALAQDACAALARELQALRSVVLKLLLVEAARLGRPAPAAPRRIAQAGLVAPVRVDPAPALSDVRFSLRLPRASEPRRRRAPAPEAQAAAPEPPPVELARRCEALRRVLADPEPYAARLCRRLHALDAHTRAAAARRIAHWRPRRLPRRRSLLHARAAICAHDHVEAFDDTG